MSNAVRDAFFCKAKDYAFLLLKFRLRSESELFERLKKKKFSPQVSKEVVAFLKEKKFINDSDFTRLWIDSRLKRPFGFRRIKQELALKGIDKDIIAAEINKVSQDYSERDIVLKLAEDKLSKLAGITQEKAKSRVFGYLVRRGFSAGIASEILREIR